MGTTVRGMSKTRVILISGALIALLLIAWGVRGRAAGASLKSSAAASASSKCSGTPVRGGDLVYERQAAAAILDPLNVLNGDIFTYNVIYSGLVRSDPTGKTNNIVPSLSDHWTVSADGKTYTFHLRPGIKFSNGQPVTAEDVAWTLNRFGNPKINAIMAAVAGGYGNATVVSSSTVRVQLAKPVAAFLYDISIWPAFVLPKNLVEKEGKAFYNHPVGTGPFMVQSFVKGSHITMVRNPYYWEKGKPYLNSVRYNFVSDSNTRILALRAGNAQEMDVVPFSQVKSLSSDKNVVVQTAKVPLFLGLWLNHLRPPLADLNVRKAMQYAINRALINTEIFDGLGKISNSVLMGFALDAPASVKLIEQDTATVTNDWFTRKFDMVFPFASFTSDLTVPDEYSDFIANWANGFHGFETSWRSPAIQKMVLNFETTRSEAVRAKEWAQIQQALMDQTPVLNVLNLPFIDAHAANVCGTNVDGLGSDHLEDTWLAH